eukprot:Awhi_evm2s2970
MSRPAQELPPPGGFSAIQFKRHLPNRGPSGLATIAGVFCITTFGFYLLLETRQEEREIKLERYAERVAIAPILQAESDRAHLRNHKELLDFEAKVMEGVPGWVVGESPFYRKGHFNVHSPYRS